MKGLPPRLIIIDMLLNCAMKYGLNLLPFE